MSLQLWIVAYDNLYPGSRSTAVVTINVIRNAHAPVFSSSKFEVTVSEKLPLGASVLQVTATDQDFGVSGMRWDHVRVDSQFLLALVFGNPFFVVSLPVPLNIPTSSTYKSMNSVYI